MNIHEKRELAHANRAKYLKAPSLKEIDSFIKELNVSDNQFERFFGMAYNTIGPIRANRGKLPAKFWHIVYEKIIPSYSTDYQELQKKQLGKSLGKTPQHITDTYIPEEPISAELDPRIARLIN